MTFYEKLREMNPGREDASLDADVAMLCPADLGLEAKEPDSCPNARAKAATLEDCRKCWDREMEGGAP